MSSITVYIVDNEGFYDCERTGDIDSVLYAVNIEQKDYTMQKPPNNAEKWRWVNNEWIADETAN